jgi:hypothetical protein
MLLDLDACQKSWLLLCPWHLQLGKQVCRLTGYGCCWSTLLFMHLRVCCCHPGICNSPEQHRHSQHQRSSNLQQQQQQQRQRRRQ